MVRQALLEGIWRQEGLKVPARQPERGRLWLGDGSCIRLRPERREHVWAYDFVEDRTHDDRKFRTLNVVDEFTHECLALQLRFSAEMCLPSLRLVGTSPAGPRDDPCRFNLLEGKPHNDAPDLLH